MRYDKAPRPLSAVIVSPPRVVRSSPTDPAAPPAGRPTLGRDQLLFGQQAVWNALKTQMDSVTQLFYSREQTAALGPVFAILAARNAVCREVDGETLARIAGTHGHQGLVAVLRGSAPSAPVQEELVSLVQAPGCAILLTGPLPAVALAALARTARYFGVSSVWLAPEAAKALHASRARAAVEALRTLPLRECPNTLAQLQAYARAGGQPVVLRRDGQHTVGALSALRRMSVLLVLPPEDGDLDATMLETMALRVRLETTAEGETLPVCVAAGIALAMLKAPSPSTPGMRTVSR